MMKRFTANLLTAALAFAAAGVANASGEDMERKLAADFEAGAPFIYLNINVSMHRMSHR